MYLEKSWREGEWEEGDSKGIFYQSYQGRTCGRVKGRNKKFPVSCSMGGKSEGTKRGEFKRHISSAMPWEERKGKNVEFKTSTKAATFWVELQGYGKRGVIKESCELFHDRRSGERLKGMNSKGIFHQPCWGRI